MIPVYKPYLTKEVIKYAHETIDSTWISSSGEYIDKTVDLLKKLFGYKHILLTNNGTTAGHLMSIGLKYKYPNFKKIVVPNNTYIASWNTLRMNPIYDFEILDSNLDTWNGDYEKYLEKNPENNVILIVHNISAVTNVNKLKEKYPKNIFLEDNCEGFLGMYDGKYTGTESYISFISFHSAKTVTSGEGGAIMFSDDNLYDFINSTRSHGNTQTKFIFDKLGYNYRMTNLSASLVYGHLKNLDEILNLKEKVFSQYEEILKNDDRIIFQGTDNGTKKSNWLFGIRFRDFDEEKLKELQLYLYTSGVETRRMFPPITYHKHYEKEICSVTNSKILYNSCLILPSYPELESEDIKKITNLVKEKL